MKTYDLKKSLVALVAALGLMLQPMLPAMAQEKTTPKTIDISKVRVPEVYGSVKESHKGNDKVIFYLQDAHCNFEAQQNISRILQDLVNQYGVDTVCTEGDAGPVDSSRLASFPDKEAMADVASYFMSQGRITGPEYLAITGDKPFALIGIEDAKLKDENDQVFKDFIPVQKEAVGQASELNRAMAQMAEKIFSPDMKAFHDMVGDYHAGKIKFTDYAQKLRDIVAKNGVDIGAFKNFASQGKSFEMEGKINFDAVEDERAAVVDELSKKLSKEDTSNLVVQSLSFRLGRMGAVEYYDLLKNDCAKAGVDMKAKANLTQYIDYIKLFDQINKDALVDEATAIEDAIRGKLITTDEQRKLDAMIHHMDMVAKMFEIKLGIRDYKVYTKSIAENSPVNVMAFITAEAPKHSVAVPSVDMASLEKSVAMIEKFYAVATQRDDVLAKNAIAMMKDKNLDKMVLITGGFHTNAITGKLANEGFSVVVITPRITDFDVKSPYVDVMMGKPTPIEELFSQRTVQAHTNRPSSQEARLAPVAEEYAMAVSAARDGNPESQKAKVQKLRDAKIDALGFAGGVAVRTGDSIRVFTAAGEAALPEAIAAEAQGVEVKAGATPDEKIITADAARLQGIMDALAKKPGTFAKTTGTSVDTAKAERLARAEKAVMAEIEAGNTAKDVTAEIHSRFGSLHPSVRTTRFIVVDDPAVLKDGQFDVGVYAAADVATDPDNNHNVLVRGNRVVALPKPQYDAMMAGDAVATKVTQEAVGKDAEKGDQLIALGYNDPKFAAPTPATAEALLKERTDIRKAADMAGLMVEAGKVGYDRILDFSYYLKNGKVAELVAMATDEATQAKKDEIDANTKMTADQKAFAQGLADRVQARALSVLLASAQSDASVLAALKAIPAGTPSKAVADKIAVVAEPMKIVLELSPSDGAVFVGFDFDKGLAVFKETGKTENTGVEIKNPALLDALRGVYAGFTFADPSAAKVNQALQEVFLMKEIGVAVEPLRALTAEHRDARQEKVEHNINLRTTVDYGTPDADGQPTKYVPTSPNVPNEINARIAKGDDVTIYDKDLKDVATIQKTFERTYGADRVKAWMETGRLHFAKGDARAVDAANAARAVEKNVPRAAKHTWVARADDGAMALNGTNGNKVAVLPEGAPYDLAEAILEATTDAQRTALLAKARRQGMDDESLAQLEAVAKDGGQGPAWKPTQVPNVNMLANPRSTGTSA